jgi:hypothetical protein
VSDPELNEISAPVQGEVKPASQDDGAPKQRKRDKRDVHGWALLDKPVGITMRWRW